MKRMFYAMLFVLFLFSCSKDEVEQTTPTTGEMTKIVFTLADGSQRAVVGGDVNPLLPADIVKYIKDVRLLVFNANDKKLVHEARWSATTGTYETWFPATIGAPYDFVIVTNSDIAGSFTSPLIRGVNTESDVIAMLKNIVPKAGVAAGNGDFGTRYQLFTRSVDPTDVNHVFHGMTTQAITAATTNIVTIPVKRIMAMINFTLNIQNPVFQPADPAAPAFAAGLALDVSRMACGLDMNLTQRLSSLSLYSDCVVRGGAFVREGTTGYLYKSTAFVYANGKNAFLSVGLKTQVASPSLAANLPRLFWVDLTTEPIGRNKIYDISATIPIGNFGGDPSSPTTINPENPDANRCNLIVNVTASDWETQHISGGGNMN
ncbi:MAG: FimB/Mfa2 family fimbrial subunit [Alistipes sp.]